VAASRPFGIEPGEVRLKNVRPTAEHIATAAAHDLAHQLAATARATSLIVHGRSA
jgi:hypothetical protein